MRVRSNATRRSGLWAVAQQVSSIGLIGVFSVVLARSISVQDFGVYSYAISLAGIAAAVSTAGLQGLALREFHNSPDRSAVICASTTLIREATGLLCVGLLITITGLTSSGEVLLATMVGMLAVFARGLDSAEIWFQSQLESKTPALARIASGWGFFAAKIGVLVVFPSGMIMVALFVAEAFVASTLIRWQFSRRAVAPGDRASFRATINESRRLAGQSAPLALSGIASQISARSDILVVQALLGSTAVGIYSASVRISEFLYVLPVAYMTATFPSLLKARQQGGADSRHYAASLQRGFDLALWAGVAVAIALVVCAGPIIDVLFGEDYSSAASILRIQALGCPFVFMGAVLSKWIIAEGRGWVSLGRHGTGALLGLTANILLMPSFGLPVAAWATVASYIVASYLFCAIFSSTRPVFWMMSRSIVAPLRRIRHYRREVDHLA